MAAGGPGRRRRAAPRHAMALRAAWGRRRRWSVVQARRSLRLAGLELGATAGDLWRSELLFAGGKAKVGHSAHSV